MSFDPESLFYLYAGAAASRIKQSTHWGIYKHSFTKGHACKYAGCTWMPEVVKYGISNLTLIGGFPSLSSASTLGRPKCARIKYSFPPCNMSWHKLFNTPGSLYWVFFFKTSATAKKAEIDNTQHTATQSLVLILRVTQVFILNHV